MAKGNSKRKNINGNDIELLVPAGGTEQFLAAVENGADAIYVGGQLFNARAGAQNFNDDEDYAHKRGVKVYVTMNTLLSDDELEPALRYASFLHDSGVDAIIVQDLGLGELVHRALPDLELHMSTQATITDVRSAKVAHELGYKRIVVARELALPEIADICRVGSDGASDFEVEVFVHGAICICYSGQCQFSRYYGGRSGNRGSCAQPCRLAYTSYGEGGRRLAAASHPMSPRDMCLLDQLGGLIDAGAASFKIEGRLKSAEYVAVVTSIYRKYIDMYLEEGYIEVSDEDRDALLQIFNRGEFTDAYLKGESGESLMSGDIVKNQGLEIGRVVATKKGSTLVDIEATSEPSIGDGAEIYGRGDAPLSSTVLSYVKELGPNRYRVGDFRGNISAGDVVRRTSRKSQLEAARQSYRGATFFEDEDARKVKRRRKIDMVLQIEGNTLVLKARTVRLAGANKEDHHMKGVCYGRDYVGDIVTDIKTLKEGDPCPHCGAPIKHTRGIEVGQIFKLGTKYSESMNATYKDENGEDQIYWMGCYGVGVTRTMQAIVEQSHDDKGIIWPMSVAPYHVIVTVINPKDEVQMDLANKIESELEAKRVEVIVDDRDERAGVKFNDADLIGIPIRITVGKLAKDGNVEYKLRREESNEVLSAEDAIKAAAELVDKEIFGL